MYDEQRSVRIIDHMYYGNIKKMWNHQPIFAFSQMFLLNHLTDSNKRSEEIVV